MKAAILVFWAALGCLAFAGGKKEKELVVSFHLQGSPADGKKISSPQDVAGTSVYFRLSPEISTKDIVSFRPFPADDGYSYGVMLALDDTGRKRLAAVTNANRGDLLLARLNGRPIDVVEIDKTVEDGMLVIWQGVTGKEIAQADAMMPRIGETVKEWKKKKKDK